MRYHFADCLFEKIRELQTPLMVGLDPRLANLPEEIRTKTNATNAESIAEAFREFCCQIVELSAGKVAVVKPQFAFFEQFGPPGFAALKSVITFAKSKGLLVVGDAKRGDIGSTATGYANAYLNPEQVGGIPCDALTVNAYMGFDTIQAFMDVAASHGRGLFVLVKTSNPGSGEFQDQAIDGRPLYQHIAEKVQLHADASKGETGFGNVGAVVGATYPEQLAELRQLMPNAPILIPGFGAQGGKAEDLKKGFDSQGLGATVNSSRGIIFAYEKEEYREQFDRWQDAVGASIDDSIRQLRAIGETTE